MTMRNLTEPFILMRNKALKRKPTYFEKFMPNTMPVTASDSEDPDEIELDNVNLGLDATLAWTDALEQTHYMLSGLHVKIDNLVELHAKQLTGPALDDISQEVAQIDQLSREIEHAFSNGYHQIQTIKAAAEDAKASVGHQLAKSAVMALSTALRDLALRYRSVQIQYLSQVKTREDGSNQSFTDDQSIFLDNAAVETWLMVSNETNSDSWDNGEQQQNQQQDQQQNYVVLQLEDPEDSVNLTAEEEEQIGDTVQSRDLKHILKDLASTVQNHGNILDRIDYNIEQTEMQVKEGNVQLKKSISLRRSKFDLDRFIVAVVCISLPSFIAFSFIVFLVMQ